MFKVNSKSTRTTSIVDFKQVNVSWVGTAITIVSIITSQFI